jgi:hypothetical protein
MVRSLRPERFWRSNIILKNRRRSGGSKFSRLSLSLQTNRRLSPRRATVAACSLLDQPSDAAPCGTDEVNRFVVPMPSETRTEFVCDISERERSSFIGISHPKSQPAPLAQSWEKRFDREN